MNEGKQNGYRKIFIYALLTGMTLALCVWYFQVTALTDADRHIAEKCWLKICEYERGPEVCFSVPLRNVSTEIFSQTDCLQLKYKCELLDYDSTHHYFFPKNCTWNGAEATCLCVV